MVATPDGSSLMARTLPDRGHERAGSHASADRIKKVIRQGARASGPLMPDDATDILHSYWLAETP